MTPGIGTTKKELGKIMYKVERKPAEPKAQWYEVMLSPFQTKEEVEQYFQKYGHNYPPEERVYRVTEF